MRARRGHAVDTGGPDEQTASRAPEHGRGLGRSQVKAKAAPRFRPARRGRQDAAHEEHEGLERARAPSGEQRASSRGGRGPRGEGVEGGRLRAQTPPRPTSCTAPRRVAPGRQLPSRKRQQEQQQRPVAHADPAPISQTTTEAAEAGSSGGRGAGEGAGRGRGLPRLEGRGGGRSLTSEWEQDYLRLILQRKGY